MAWSLETDGFLKALTRMVARRGWPRDMLSDNGTNFVGGNNELKELVQHLDQDIVQRIQFKFKFKSLFIRSKDKNTYLMLQVNIKITLVKFTSYE
jgi:hypothetical protein